MATARGDARQRADARPGSIDCRRILKQLLSLSIMLPVVLPCPARAAEWTFGPSLAVTETYTDNLFLTRDEFRQSDWVTTVTPGIAITATGSRLVFKANYAPEFVYYGQELQENEIFQRGNAIGTAELAQQLLFFDFGGLVDQYPISLRGPITTSNVNITANRATVWNTYASPYLQREGSDLKGELRYRYSVVRSDDPFNFTSQNSTANRVDLRLGSGPAYKLLAGKLEYFKEVVDYDNGQENISESIKANLRRQITPTLAVLGEVGYEYYLTGTVAPASEGRSWSAGFDWMPTARTRLVATAGERFFGNSYLLDLTHRTRLTSWGASYSENITNTRNQFFVPATTSTAGFLDAAFMSQFPDPVARQKAVDDFIARTGIPPSLSSPVNFFTNEEFLAKRWLASASILGVSNVVIANAFKETRERLVGNLLIPGVGGFGGDDAITQTGGSFVWNLRLSARDTWNLGGTYSRNEFFGSDRVDHVSLVGTGYTRKLLPRMSGSLTYRWRQDDSTDPGSNYTENSVSLTLKATF